MEGYPGTGGTMTVSRQAFTTGQTDVPNDPTYYLSADITTAGSGSGEFHHNIEDVRTLAGKTIVVSFWVKSSGTPTFYSRTKQNFGSGGSASGHLTHATTTLSTSWQKVTYTTTLGTMSGKTIGANSYLELNWYWANTSTTTADVYIAQVKIEEGSTATSFESKSYGEELRACQRYYYAHIGPNCVVDQLIGKGAWNSATQLESTVHFKETMRVTPTLVTSSGTNYYRYHGGGTSGYMTWVNIHGQQANCASLYTTVTRPTTGYGANLVAGHTNAYVHFNAEL